MDFANFPQPPKPIYSQQSYTTDGKPVPTETYAPAEQTHTLGASFSGLIGNQVTVPAYPVAEIQTPTKKKSRKKKDENGNVNVEVGDDKESTDIETVNSREIVESTLYSDTYMATNKMTYNIIGQADELLTDCKQELDFIRSQRNMKGKYHYMNATIASMSSLLSTKLAAIKEINGNIKSVNELEYRRFKDMRALDTTDDNKAIMDAYSAFISAPVGAPQYKQPGTMALTGGLDGIIRADYPADVQKTMDAGMANYLGNLSPEENLMLHDSNPDIEEVLVYDEATGAKQFQWMNTQTGEILNNMPISSDLVLEDFVIDKRMGIAKNTNLNIIKKVVILNEGAFDKF